MLFNVLAVHELLAGMTFADRLSSLSAKGMTAKS